MAIGSDKLVYVIVADKKLKYPKGRSRMAYVGTTKHGVSRVAQSAASRADQILREPGVRSFRVHVVTCRPKAGVRTWLKLERAVLLAFRERFGEVPVCNSQGKRMKERDEFEKYFARARIKRVIEDLS